MPGRVGCPSREQARRFTFFLELLDWLQNVGGPSIQRIAIAMAAHHRYAYTLYIYHIYINQLLLVGVHVSWQVGVNGLL